MKGLFCFMKHNYNTIELRNALKSRLTNTIVKDILVSLGQEFKGFTFRDNTSFSINKTGNIKDFGSTGFSGDIISYLVDILNMDFIQSLELVSKHINLDISQYQTTIHTPTEDKKGINEFINIYNKERLHQSLDYNTPNEIYFKGINNYEFNAKDSLLNVA
jgi:hypothetical protein